uniref:Uncharacterized protein n=1 Tax=Parascaris univalens TaxID=6257 RepID=A0A914ZWA1_PARUN
MCPGNFYRRARQIYLAKTHSKPDCFSRKYSYVTRAGPMRATFTLQDSHTSVVYDYSSEQPQITLRFRKISKKRLISIQMMRQHQLRRRMTGWRTSPIDQARTPSRYIGVQVVNVIQAHVP